MSARADRAGRNAFRLVALFVVQLSACGNHGRPVAELSAMSGSVERRESEKDGPPQAPGWHPVKLGQRFWLFDGVRTFADGYAELALNPAGKLRVQPNTSVTFSNTANDKSPRQVIVNGVIEAETSTVEIDVIMQEHADQPYAHALVRRGSLVRVSSSAESRRFEVRVGKVEVEQDGARKQIGAGEVFELQVGKPQVEPETKPPPPADAGAPAPAELAGVRFDPAPGRAELTIVAGESATVHHPGPPVRVRVAFGGCAGELAVESAHAALPYGEQRVRGRGAAVLRLPAGQYRYRVLCIDGGALATTPSAEGVLRIRADNGLRKLSAGAPKANVDADGRRYTVRFPALPPALVLRWPNAPKAGKYSLQLEPEHGAPRTMSAAEPSVTLPPGTLGEGTHRFWFQAGAARSPLGQLRVEFDPTGRTASLSSPIDKGFAAGADTEVKGSVVAGASVSVEGGKVTVDRAGHFDTHVRAPSGNDALAVRVQHPAIGIHYYLRRVSHAEP